MIYNAFFAVFNKLLLVTIPINKKLNNKTSFLENKLISVPIEASMIISLNQICPDFNSSFVIFARKLPIGKPKRSMKIPTANLIISFI